MKSHLVKTLVVVGLVLGAWHLGEAQSRVAQFHLTVQRTATGIKMECTQGCAWTALSFSLSGDRAQAVDGMGMTE
jgi:hypothetical protein